MVRHRIEGALSLRVLFSEYFECMHVCKGLVIDWAEENGRLDHIDLRSEKVKAHVLYYRLLGQVQR